LQRQGDGSTHESVSCSRLSTGDKINARLVAIGLDTRSKQARLAIKSIKKVDFGVIQEKIHQPSNLYAEVSIKPGLTRGSLELSDLNLTQGNHLFHSSDGVWPVAF
jgi:hypothetical protein